jgi:hypothetical protein
LEIVKIWECEKSSDIFGKVIFIVMIRGYFSLYLRPSIIIILLIYETGGSIVKINIRLSLLKKIDIYH